MPNGIRSNVAKGTARMRGNVPLFAGLLVGSWILWGSSLQAEILYDRDGIQLQGTARILLYKAAVCRVLEASHSEAKYEAMKANDGQALHLWQLDYSAYNGTGRPLSRLRASFNIESEWPPCTNWSGPEAGWQESIDSPDYSQPLRWVGGFQDLHKPEGMAADEVVREKIYLLVFHQQQPRFKNWSVDFTFGEPDKIARPAPLPTEKAAVSPSESGPDRGQKVRTGSPSSFQNEPTCAGKPKGSKCWMELANQPGCHVWNEYLAPDETVAGKAECVEGVAQGSVNLKWVWNNGKNSMEGTGHLQEGKRHGRWVERRAHGTVWEGPYVEGERHGRWVIRDADGGVWEGPYAEGMTVGRWVGRLANGGVWGGTHVEGKRHGRWVIRDADGTVLEGPYVEGKRHGRWVTRWADGSTYVPIYNRGERVDN